MVTAQDRRRLDLGPTVDAAAKKHPDLIAYEQLPEDKKECDRDTAMETIKAIRSLGFTISKPASPAEANLRNHPPVA